MGIEIQGLEQLAALAKKLKEAGEKGLARELSKGIADAVKPLKQELKQSAAETLPSSGGLAAKVAGGQFRTVRNPRGVRVTAANAYALRRLDQGSVRHPVHGRDVWVTQTITPGWWTGPTLGSQPGIAAQIEIAMDRVAKQAGG